MGKLGVQSRAATDKEAEGAEETRRFNSSRGGRNEQARSHARGYDHQLLQERHHLQYRIKIDIFLADHGTLSGQKPPTR